VEELSIPISNTLKPHSYKPRSYTDEAEKDLQRRIGDVDPLAIVMATRERYLRVVDRIRKQFSDRPVITVILAEPSCI